MVTVVKHVGFRSVVFDDEKGADAQGQLAPNGELFASRASRSRTASESGSEGENPAVFHMLDPTSELPEELLSPMACALQTLVEENEEMRRIDSGSNVVRVPVAG